METFPPGVLDELKLGYQILNDLNPRLIGSKDEPVYVLMLEATLPQGLSIEDAAGLLEELKKELKVEIAVRAITPVSL